MWDEKSIYLEIERGSAFTPDMKDGFFEKFNTQTFTQVGAVLKILYDKTKDLIIQPMQVREKVKVER